MKGSPFEPDSKKKIKEIGTVTRKIAEEILLLKNSFIRLKNFEIENALKREDLIWYRNAISTEKNPLFGREDNSRVKRQAQPEEIEVFDQKEGLEIYISFTEYDEFRSKQNIVIPQLWICNHAVEFKVKGPETEEIRNKIEKILLGQKQAAE